jgi:hypothetical protein
VRRVVIQGTPPQDWIDEANALTVLLDAALTEVERAEIIENNQTLWRDDRIRNWLLQQFNNKCWYTEAQESVSSYHVDHYRPKGRVKDLEGNVSEGYWWLAFDWGNYRICGQLINVKKLDVFPLVEGLRATQDPVSLELESPLIIDPTTNETRFISYEQDEDVCLAVVAAGISPIETLRAQESINVLGLNIRDRLNTKRRSFWDDCSQMITEYRNAQAPQALRKVLQASAVTKLKKMVNYKTEFSSVAEACIRKNAPEALIACVFESTVQ